VGSHFGLVVLLAILAGIVLTVAVVAMFVIDLLL
jgi:hypothetical protein